RSPRTWPPSPPASRSPRAPPAASPAAPPAAPPACAGSGTRAAPSSTPADAGDRVELAEARDQLFVDARQLGGDDTAAGVVAQLEAAGLPADQLQRPEREDRQAGADGRGPVVAGAGRHPDRGDDPERAGGRQAAHGQPLAQDRAGAEEADPGHDLRGDPRRIGADDVRAARQEVVETVRRDDREEGGAERDEQVRTDAGLAIADLALDPDGRAERRGDGEPQERVPAAEGGDATREEHRSPPAGR